jgi:hypothetical protein
MSTLAATATVFVALLSNGVENKVLDERSFDTMYDCIFFMGAVAYDDNNNDRVGEVVKKLSRNDDGDIILQFMLKDRAEPQLVTYACINTDAEA